MRIRRPGDQGSDKHCPWWPWGWVSLSSLCTKHFSCFTLVPALLKGEGMATSARNKYPVTRVIFLFHHNRIGIISKSLHMKILLPPPCHKGYNRPSSIEWDASKADLDCLFQKTLLYESEMITASNLPGCHPARAYDADLGVSCWLLWMTFTQTGQPSGSWQTAKTWTSRIMFAIDVSKYQVLNIKNLKSGREYTLHIYIDFTFNVSSFPCFKSRHPQKYFKCMDGRDFPGSLLLLARETKLAKLTCHLHLFGFPKEASPPSSSWNSPFWDRGPMTRLIIKL